MKEPKSKYGKRFSEEFQREAVRMLESGERTAKQLQSGTWRIGMEPEAIGKIPRTHRSSQGAGSRIGARVGECEIAPRTGDGEPATGHIKKGIRHLGPRTEQLYEVIGIMEQDATYKRKELSLALGVSRSGRYNHLHKANKGRRQENERCGARIVEIFGQSRGRYGCAAYPSDASARRHPLRQGADFAADETPGIEDAAEASLPAQNDPKPA